VRKREVEEGSDCVTGKASGDVTVDFGNVRQLFALKRHDSESLDLFGHHRTFLTQFSFGAFVHRLVLVQFACCSTENDTPISQVELVVVRSRECF
jgi:hypothetical protein